MEPAAAKHAPLEELSSANTDDASEVRALTRALNRSSGFTLLFACCNDSTRREELTKELSASNGSGSSAPRAIFLHHGENVLNLAATLRERLAVGTKPSVVFVDGLENVLPQAREAGQSVFVANLNAYRNALPGAVPVPLVLWVTDWLLGVIARHAPDLFSVKSGVYFFREEARADTEYVGRGLDVEPRLGWENVPRAELRARAEEIRALLNAPRTSSLESSLLEAHLAGRLGDIYLDLYQIIDAEAAYSQSRNHLEKVVQETVFEKALGENDLAVIYHQLGMVAQERRDFAAAEEWYRKSLGIERRLGNKHGAAATYHQLGRVAEERRDFAAAEEWYRKSLKIERRLSDERGAAATCHQLGMIAQERRDFAAAEKWYQQAREIKERLGNEHGAASTYHQLGMIAQEWRDFAAAEEWYQRARAIKERLGDEHGAAATYHQLGRVAEEWRDFAAAEEWYQRACEINERLGDEYGAAVTHGQLGLLAGRQNDFENAGRWQMRSIATFVRLNDDRFAQQATKDFLSSYKHSTNPVREKLKALWKAAGIGPFPQEEGNSEEPV